MTRRKRQTRQDDVFGVIVGFAEAVDTAFEKLTGKPIAAWLREFQRQPGELPGGEQAVATQPAMLLADAYAIMGLPPTASLQQVKKRYRILARLFHPDAPGGYVEAMKLLNNAYDRIVKGESSG